MKIAALIHENRVTFAIGILNGAAINIALVAAGVESPALRFLLGVAIAVPTSAVLFTAYLALVHYMRHR